MAQYFFHIRGEQQPCGGTVGLELPSLREAKRAAFVLAGTLLVAPDAKYRAIANWAIDVTNGENHVLLTLAFHQSVAACVSLQSMVGYYGASSANLPEVIGLAS